MLLRGVVEEKAAEIEALREELRTRRTELEEQAALVPYAARAEALGEALGVLRGYACACCASRPFEGIEGLEGVLAAHNEVCVRPRPRSAHAPRVTGGGVSARTRAQECQLRSELAVVCQRLEEAAAERETADSARASDQAVFDAALDGEQRAAERARADAVVLRAELHSARAQVRSDAHAHVAGVRPRV